MKNSKLYQIGELAQLANISVQTIRYYEKRKLLAPKGRKQSKFRLYDDESIKTIRFIRNAKEIGFNLEEICELLVIRNTSGGNGEKAREHTLKKMEQLKLHIQKLKTMHKRLSKLYSECESSGEDFCSILENLEQSDF